MTTCSAMRSRMLRVNAGEPRRKRQIILLLSAILIPTAVLITFAIRLSRQDAELAEKRVADERRDALDQLRRELSARLEAIKLRELSRFSGDCTNGGFSGSFRRGAGSKPAGAAVGYFPSAGNTLIASRPVSKARRRKRVSGRRLFRRLCRL